MAHCKTKGTSDNLYDVKIIHYDKRYHKEFKVKLISWIVFMEALLKNASP